MNPKKAQNVSKAAKSNTGKKVSDEGKKNIGKGKRDSAERGKEISGSGKAYTESVRTKDGKVWKIHLNDGLPE